MGDDDGDQRVDGVRIGVEIVDDCGQAPQPQLEAVLSAILTCLAAGAVE